ncbi:MAG TPA: dihydrofolate reductase family protein [Solirubrobacteraceae bacterium]|nr:dihydrofolate reductase family protein [Solirubrobacteraceae bacterium]
MVTEFVSLDGVAEDPGGAEGYAQGGWAFKFDRGAGGDRFKAEELEAADAHLLGRVTYQAFAEAWPSRSGEFADKLNSMPKHVVSSSPLTPDWTNSSRLEGELETEVRALKERYAGEVLIAGSLGLVQALTELGLVDEYRLMIYPILLGGGKRLFAPGGPPHPLRMVRHERAGDCLTVIYEPAPSR